MLLIQDQILTDNIGLQNRLRKLSLQGRHTYPFAIPFIVGCLYYRWFDLYVHVNDVKLSNRSYDQYNTLYSNSFRSTSQ
jgi:hypothetical protein